MHSKSPASRSAIVYQKRAHELSPKVLQSPHNPPVYQSQFTYSPNIESSSQQKPSRIMAMQASGKDLIFNRNRYQQRQPIREMQWQTQKSRLATMNDKIGEQTQQLKNRNLRNNEGVEDRFSEKSGSNMRKRKRKIFDSAKGSNIMRNSSLKKSCGSYQSRRNYYQRQRIKTNPIAQKIPSYRHHRSYQKISQPNEQTPLQTRRYIQNPPSVPLTKFHHNSINNHNQKFRPDAPIIISYNTPVNQDKIYHHNPMPSTIYPSGTNSNYDRPLPFTQKPIISSQMYQSSHQASRTSDLHSKPKPETNHWNMSSQTSLNQLIRKPLIYRSIEVKDQIPSYPQSDKIFSTQTREEKAKGYHQPYNRTQKHPYQNEPNRNFRNQYDRNQLKKQNETTPNHKLSSLIDPEESSEHTHKDFFDFSPSNPKQKPNDGYGNSTLNDFPKVLISPNKRSQSDQDQCDRFFDMDFYEDQKKINSAEENCEWLSMKKKQSDRQYLSPLQHKFEKPQTFVKKQGQTSSNLAAKIKLLINNADTEGKVITMILVSVGILLVLLQVFK